MAVRKTRGHLSHRNESPRVRARSAWIGPAVLISALLFATVTTAAAQLPSSGKRYPRLIVRNAIIIEGNGTPASGPKDIVIEMGLISDIVPMDSGALKRPGFKRPVGDVEIDAAGKYVMPGLINLHGHVQEERAGIPQPLDYELKLWLACGITTVRDLGSDLDRTLALRRDSAEGRVAAPAFSSTRSSMPIRRRATRPKRGRASAS